jgi:hypothetical protein
MPSVYNEALNWLDHEQMQRGTLKSPEVVRWVPLSAIVEDDPYSGTFVLHRLNEGRDNLRRNLNGPLFLVGGSGMLRRIANEAPDLWSVRVATIEFEDSEDLDFFEEPTRPAEVAPFPFDVCLHGSHDDIDFLQALQKRLITDGITVCTVADGVRPGETISNEIADCMNKSRFFVPLLSPRYVESNWLEFGFDKKRQPIFASRTLPIMLRDVVPPTQLQHLSYLDWRTPQKIEESYPKLVRTILDARHTSPLPAPSAIS